jgi:hypothetical protein
MTVIESKVRKGLLQLEGDSAGVWETFSCQPTSVAITPTVNAGTTGDNVEVLCGDVISGDTTEDERAATLSVDAIQDFANPTGLQAYSWKHSGLPRRFRWRATDQDDDTWEGIVKIQPITVGGTVGERLNQSFEWDTQTLKLPVRFGGEWWIGKAGSIPVSVAKKGMVEPNFLFPTDAAVSTVADLTPQGYVAKNPSNAWAPGESFGVGTNIEAHWDGAEWASGAA